MVQSVFMISYLLVLMMYIALLPSGNENHQRVLVFLRLRGEMRRYRQEFLFI